MKNDYYYTFNSDICELTLVYLYHNDHTYRTLFETLQYSQWIILILALSLKSRPFGFIYM